MPQGPLIQFAAKRSQPARVRIGGTDYVIAPAPKNRIAWYVEVEDAVGNPVLRETTPPPPSAVATALWGLARRQE